MGISVDSLEEARAILRLDATGAHLNADGIVHGGVLPSLADESNLRYVRPASAGPVAAYGRVVQAHRSVAFTEVEIVDGEERLLARGGGTFLLRMDE